jgi:hypothetical protein
LQGNFKLQPAVDFLSSYGIVILAITIALIAISTIAFNTPQTPGCTAPPGFNCNYIAINKAGVLTAKISQALGTQITINGVACADQQNYTYDTPRYGNVGVNALPKNYPSPTLWQTPSNPSNVIYSGGYYVLQVQCYQVGASNAIGNLGSQFTGYLWLNYTILNYRSQVQKIATFTAVYS